MNPLLWSTSTTTDLRYAYLTVMRDLKKYCAKGYIDTELFLITHMTICGSLVTKLMKDAPEELQVIIFIIDWKNEDQVRTTLETIIKLVSFMSHNTFRADLFASAFSEFGQYLKKYKIK